MNTRSKNMNAKLMENNASTVGGERCACSIQVGVGERISSASSSLAILLQKLMASHLVDKPFILTSYRPRIGPELQSELRYTAHEILAGVALRSIQICLSVLEVRSISKSQRSMQESLGRYWLSIIISLAFPLGTSMPSHILM